MASEALSSKSETDWPQLVQSAARRAMQRCDELANCTDRPGEIARFFCSPAMKSAHGLVRNWMEAAGLNCRMDAAGNFIARLLLNSKLRASSPSAGEGRVRGKTDEKTLLIGSHLDTVANAGKYDGILGVMLGLAVTEIAVESNVALPFAVDVIAFSEEEGVRYQTPFIGSRALVGDMPAEHLNRTDADGIALADALRNFGCNPHELPDEVYQPDEVIAYIEPHIEQGPVLEAENLPVGIVTGITGQTRAEFQFIGKAGHAGAVPMAARQDALVAAAKFITDVERLARNRPGLVATVGQMEVLPNVSNVIPGEVNLSLDVRHQGDDTRDAAFREMTHQAALIAEERDIEFDLGRTQSYRAVACDPKCQELLQEAVIESGIRPFRLPSGAGHDAAIMSRKFPVGMLFLRCAGGVSHHPDESVSEADVTAALQVLWRFVMKLAAPNPTEMNNNTH
jgi:allantoate deiminase